MRSVRRAPRPTAGALIVSVIMAAVAVPLVAVSIRSFVKTPGFDAAGAGSAWGRILTEWRTWRVVGLTVAQAAVSTVVTICLGVPMAYVMTRFRFPGRSFLRVMVTVPFVLPSVVVGAAFAALSGPGTNRGVIASWVLIIAAHLCFNLAVAVRVVGAAFERFSADTEAAARMLGRSPMGAFWSVELPAVAQSIVAAAIVVMLFTLTSFGVIVMLGGGQVTTIEVEIWTRATRQFDLSGAAVLSIVQFIAVAGVLALDIVMARRSPLSRSRSTRVASLPRGAAQVLLVILCSAFAVMICGVPLGALALRSLRVPGGLGLDNWASMGSVLSGTGIELSALDAIGNSLIFATAATAIAALLAVPASRSLAGEFRAGSTLMLLPLGVSATTIGLGLLIAFGRPPFDLRGSGWLILLAQAMITTPLMARIVAPATRQLDPAVLDAAMTLGATRRERYLRVELPLVAPAYIAALSLGFVTALGEFGATVFVSRGSHLTMPVLMQRLMSRPGGSGYGQSMALAVVMVAICGTALGIVDRIGRRGTVAVI